MLIFPFPLRTLWLAFITAEGTKGAKDFSDEK